MEERTKIDGEKLKAAIAASSYTQKELCIMFDKNAHYLSQGVTDGLISNEFLTKVCTLLRKKPDDFKTTEPEKPGDEHAEDLEDMAAALVSITQMMEAMQGTVKRMSDELSTLKDTEFQASQEAKRYYQTAKSLFNKIESWIRNGRNE